MIKRLFLQGISYLSFFNIKTFKVLIAGVLFSLSGENIALAQADWISGKPERVITFSGFDWLVKSSHNTITGSMAPGDNYFSDSMENVWVDKNGWLHLKITKKNGKWYCAEVTLTKPLGYKRYIFQVNSRVDLFHPNVVGGLFTYLDGTDNAEEIDIELSRWGDNKKANILYAIQPSDSIGNANSFRLDLNGDASTHQFDWKSGNVVFKSFHGHYTSTPTDSKLIVDEWNYSGEYVPADANGKVHINLWLFQRQKIDPNDHLETELVINSFLAL